MVTRFIAPQPVFAQNAIPNELRARSFALTDQNGRTAATFTAEPVNMGQGYRVILRAPNGNVLWSAGGTPLRPLLSGSR
jgi:hypothetical protein